MEGEIGTTMSDADATEGERQVSQRFSQIEDELREGDSLGSLMAEQWRGMAGMAGMFVATIALAMYIRPYYDVGELHAFGASGATQVRYVAIELLAIFAFTALIIFLARWGKEYIIKYGMYAVLSIALMYTMVPLAHMLVLDFETDPFVMESDELLTGTMLGTWGDDGFILANISEGFTNTSVDITAWDATNDYSEPVWRMTHAHQLYDVSSSVSMTSSAEHLTFATGAYAWSVVSATGELTESYACYKWVDDEAVPLDNMFGGCAIAVSTEDAMYLTNPFDELLRFKTFDTDPGLLVPEGRWRIPNFVTSDGPIMSHLLSDDEWLLVTKSQAASILLEDTTPALDLGLGGMSNATYLIELQPDEDADFTSADVGWSPFMEENISTAQASPDTRHQRLLLFGETNGTITGVEWNGSAPQDEAYTVQDRLLLSGLVDSVDSVRITDLDDSGYSDLLVAGDGDAHWLYTTSLVNRASFPVDDNASAVFFAVDENRTELVVLSATSDETTLLQTGELTSEMFPLYGLQLYLGPTLAGLAVSILLLILLFVHSEWYVVNTTGVLLGAGVSVMLGVTFVPALAILFMMLAAVYDFWAVYKSKHMLDLADTMVGLRLPILLVAPQDSDYSLIEETERGKRPAPSPPPEGMKVKRVKKKNSEAMFMGLGDIIFPGMLVLSAMQWLDPSVAFGIAMSTLAGALLGYLALMTYVARGKAQAGLPLLNGGAILGYFIGGLLLMGGDIFMFNISW
jgi:presenilin-like A22 family membrane protease